MWAETKTLLQENSELRDAKNKGIYLSFVSRVSTPGGQAVLSISCRAGLPPSGGCASPVLCASSRVLEALRPRSSRSQCVPLVGVSSMTWPNCRCAVVGIPMAGLDSAPVKSGQRGFWGSLLISTRGLWAECRHSEQWSKLGKQRGQVEEMQSIPTAGISQSVFPVETLDDDLNSMSMDGVRCAKHFLRNSWCVSLTPFSPAQGRASEFKALWHPYKAASTGSCLGVSSSLVTHLVTTPNPLSTAREIF